MLLSQFTARPGMRIGMCAGTFDPVTLGHHDMLENTLTEGEIDFLIVIPNADSPEFKSYKPEASSNSDRTQMLILAYKDHPRIIVMDVAFPTDVYERAVKEKLIAETKGQIKIANVVGTDLALRYETMPDHRIVPVDRLIVHERYGYEGKVPDVIRGMPVKHLKATKPETAGVSSTDVKAFLRTHDGFYETDVLPPTSELAVLPVIARFIQRTGRYRATCKKALSELGQR